MDNKNENLNPGDDIRPRPVLKDPPTFDLNEYPNEFIRELL